MHSQTDLISWQINKKQALARNILFRNLKLIQDASLVIIDPQGQIFQFGDKESDLHAKIILHHPDFYQQILSQGSIGAAEAYIDGYWDSPDLTKIISLICRNITMLDKVENQVSWLTSWLKKINHWRNRNTQKNSRHNIAAHYDIGNDLYCRFLDKNMLYSSGIYLSAQDSLEQAQVQKMDRLCRLLSLSEENHLLEIGSGWGAMAIYAAKHYGCKVTTTTISQEQYQWAKLQIEKEQLQDQITILKQDYRELEGQYDKIISIEMIEAVGKAYIPIFLKKCQALLKPKGLMAIQAITILDQRFEIYSKDVDFIQKYIFPGGFLPSITSLLKSSTQHSNFVLRDLKDIGLDYAKTLKAWQQRFDLNRHELKELGYDERFERLWRYYFCYCEGGFRERTISTVQLLFAKQH